MSILLEKSNAKIALLKTKSIPTQESNTLQTTQTDLGIRKMDL